MYILIVEGKEVISSYGNPLSREGEEYYVCKELEGWVEATGKALTFYTEGVPREIKTFRTQEEAITFAKKWKGHPWWVKPNGSFRVLKVTPRYCIDGWEEE